MERTYNILVVDDHREIRELLSRFLLQHGFNVSIAADGGEMEKQMNHRHFDLLILDLMLPGKDGITLCREIRATSNIPIIMLTALGEEIDRIVGLEVGADDYIPKPFNPRELLARIKSVLRRHFTIPNVNEQISTGNIRYQFSGWALDSKTRELTNPAGALVTLTSTEFELLLAFLLHPNVVLTREDLLKLVQGRGADVYDRAVDTLISRLRKKIEEDPKSPKLIKTIWGGGYQFSCEVTHDYLVSTTKAYSPDWFDYLRRVCCEFFPFSLFAFFRKIKEPDFSIIIGRHTACHLSGQYFIADTGRTASLYYSGEW